MLPDVERRRRSAPSSRPGARFVRIKRELTPKQQEEIHELGLPGLAFIDEYRRVYPMGATASHVVGLVDVDSKGLSGIEKFIDDNPQLAMSHPENAEGDEAVTISLDLGVQHVLREELKNAVATFHAKAAAGLVVDVHSGEVVGLVSLPDFDPNHREQALDKDRLNRIGFGVYEMGSVFKVFTVAGVLDSGLANIRSVYDASSPIHYASFTIEDFHGQHRPLSRAGGVHLLVEYWCRQDGAADGRRPPSRLAQEARVAEPRLDRDRRDRRADHSAALAEVEHHDHRFRPWIVGDADAACRRDASRSSTAASPCSRPSCRARARRA